MSKAAATQLRFYDLEPEANTLYEDVLHGLGQAQKFIPPKYFYDEHGSRLFDAICETAEYYPTRTEMAILEENLEEICACLGSDCVLVEPGSGSSRKVRLLLDRLEPHTYMPLDISSDYLKSVAHGLAEEYPHINVAAACVDYTAPIVLPCFPKNRRRVAFFPGSSIGNFEPDQAVTFLGNLADLVKPDGGLLIGVDLKKEASVLNTAYNDQHGVTARFNINLLTHINRELEADFDLDGFEHQAFYNVLQGRVEMYLVSKRKQQVSVAGQQFHFEAGESIHTENSYKYTVEEFQALARQAGFRACKAWTDRDRLFSVQYFV
jgi:dimethylhistidine N-methyltransferase